LEALQHFLAKVPEDSGLAYVVVQHLDPAHRALLAELLQRVTTIPVCEAVQSMLLEPNRVYVIPPNSEMTVAEDLTHLTPPSQPRGLRLPIDAFFYSLARAKTDRAIGVVFSGMGSDGTLGLLAIKRHGGITLAQNPDSAQFDSMPSSAIAAGCVDVVAAPDALPEIVSRFAGLHQSHAVAASYAPPSLPPSEDRSACLQSILSMLRERSKHDLSFYKTSTLLRRVERRMAVHGLPSMSAYENFLRENPNELDLMFREMLIGVTAFFRDPDIWRQMKDLVLPRLLERRAPTPLRAWVVGCSTGEEAYSLAMIFQEVITGLALEKRSTLQIFASDLSADAVEFARKGRYPQAIAADVGRERLDRFFSEDNGHFTVQQQIREMVLFAQHDVILDPPFTRLDIISCRNLLIYFNTALQRRLMPLFRYCLRAGGTLLLGESETVGPSQSLFVPMSPKSRIYTSSGVSVEHRAVMFPVALRPMPKKRTQESVVSKPSQSVSVKSLVDQFILQEFTPPAVLVNNWGDILYINGRTGRYLEPAAGKADWNIHVMARLGIRTQLAEAMRQIAQGSESVELRGLKVEDGVEPPVDVIVRPIRDVNALEGMVLIVFQDVIAAPSATPKRRRRDRDAEIAIADELQRSRDEIRALRQEAHASKEELQAANEELQSTNEELQSANEELTTSKEEAQSMNEELQTLNGELRTKLEDLALAQSDMQNLLNSTHIATLFLDSDLNVRRFTDQATQIVHLREVDIGRPLSELSSTLDYANLEMDAKETLRTLIMSEKEIATTDQQWFSVRIMPYRTASNVIQGVVITFVNITAAKKLESRLRSE